MTSPIQRWQVGDVRITTVLEQNTTAIGRWVLPQATPEKVAELPWLRKSIQPNPPPSERSRLRSRLVLIPTRPVAVKLSYSPQFF